MVGPHGGSTVQSVDSELREYEDQRKGRAWETFPALKARMEIEGSVDQHNHVVGGTEGAGEMGKMISLGIL